MPNILESYFSIKREQKPINQFIELKNTNIFFQIFKKDSKYKLSLFLFLVFIFELSFYLNNIFFLLIIFSFANFFLWKSIFKSFWEEKIYYEESSWFDTKVWQKPIFFLKNDRIFANQNLRYNISLGQKFFLFQIFLFPLFYFLN